MTSPLCLWVDHGIFTFKVLSPHHCTTHAFIRQDLQPREGGRDKKKKKSVQSQWQGCSLRSYRCHFLRIRWLQHSSLCQASSSWGRVPLPQVPVMTHILCGSYIKPSTLELLLTRPHLLHLPLRQTVPYMGGSDDIHLAIFPPSVSPGGGYDGGSFSAWLPTRHLQSHNSPAIPAGAFPAGPHCQAERQKNTIVEQALYVQGDTEMSVWVI